jgi:hypothetical protein
MKNLFALKLLILSCCLLFCGSSVFAQNEDPLFIDENGIVQLGKKSGLALKVEPSSDKTVSLGRTLSSSLSFQHDFGTLINSSANIAFNINTEGKSKDLDLYIDFAKKRNSGYAEADQSLMRILGNGDVGIGIISPSARLHVDKGDVRVTGGSLYVDKKLEVGKSKLVVTPNGSVGIGTPSPSTAYKLDVNGPANVSGPLWAKSLIAGGEKESMKLAVSSKGEVGIGTQNPTKAKLQINGNKSYTPTPEDRPILYLLGLEKEGDGKTWIQGTQYDYGIPSNRKFSIYASDEIFAPKVTIRSDARAKQIAGLSNRQKDLEVLKKIEITDYWMKDVIAHGLQSHKKVIAQQVKEVFPQAVTLSTDEVPDVYQHATIENGWVNLATDLQMGERILLIFDTERVVFEVLETSPKGFRVDTDRQGEVFVYGREVNDFHSVDYDAISMLNVSATQELARQNEALTRRVAELEAQLEDFHALKSAVAELQSMLQKDEKVRTTPVETTTVEVTTLEMANPGKK